MYKNTSEAHTNIAGLVKLSKGTGIKLKVISQLKVKTGEDVFVTTIKATHQCNRKYLLRGFGDGNYKAIDTFADLKTQVLQM